jgi:hypothetical protein
MCYELEVFDDGQLRIAKLQILPSLPIHRVFTTESELVADLVTLGYETSIPEILYEVWSAKIGQSLEFKLNGSRIR